MAILTIDDYPFPHAIVENALSQDAYEHLKQGWNTAIRTRVAANPLKENRIPSSDFAWKSAMAEQLKQAFSVDGAPTIGRYMLRKRGYRLLPHIDPPGLLLTVLHYLPDNNQDQVMGTVLYHASKPAYHVGTGAEYFRCPCEPVGRVPFAPNVMLAFLGTPLSAHGVEVLTEDRLTYQWHIVS